MFVACATNFEWWECLWMIQHMFLATTNLFCATHLTLHLSWRRIAIALCSATFVMDSPDMSGALNTWTHMKTWQIYSPSRYMGRSGGNLCVYFYIICKMVKHTCWVAELFINQPVNSTYYLMKNIILWPLPSVAPVLTSSWSDCWNVSTCTAELFCFIQNWFYSWQKYFVFPRMGFIYEKKAKKWKFTDFILKVREREREWDVCYLR